MHYRLSRSVDGKQYTWVWLDEPTATDLSTLAGMHDYRFGIHITTWKGEFHLLCKPTCGHEILLITRGERPCLWSIDTCDKPSECPTCHGTTNQIVLHPITQQWVECPNIEIIYADIVQWILAQPPQIEQMRKVHKEDRNSVEATFTNILAEKTGKCTSK